MKIPRTNQPTPHPMQSNWAKQSTTCSKTHICNRSSQHHHLLKKQTNKKNNLTFSDNYSLVNFYNSWEWREQSSRTDAAVYVCLSARLFITVYITLLQRYFTLVACSAHTVGQNYWLPAAMSSLLIWNSPVTATIHFSHAHKLSRCGLLAWLFSVFMAVILCIFWNW